MKRGLRSWSQKGLRLSEGDVDPLQGIVNIADAMLVFACGLMLALAIHWNVDLAPIGERINLKQGQEVTEAPDVRDDLIETQEGQGELYERMGTVYKDPVSGQLFMLTDE